MEEKHKGKALALLRAAGKYKAVLLVIAAGVVCLLWPSGGGGDKEISLTEAADQPSAEEARLERIQEEMEEILGRIQGVGQLQLMLTVDRGTEQVLAGDSSLSYSGDTAAPEDYSRSSETVVLSGDGGSVVNSRVPSSMTSTVRTSSLKTTSFRKRPTGNCASRRAKYSRSTNTRR